VSLLLYAYTGNDPISFRNPSGLKPGDQYQSKQCAGWNATHDIDPTSIAKNLEYGGFIT
jgi:hypothetical protein